MLTALALVLLSANPAAEALKSCKVSLANASSSLDDCKGVKRAKHGWLGLVKSGTSWSLAELSSRNSANELGLCAVEETWSGLARKGDRLKSGAIAVTEFQGGAVRVCSSLASGATD